MASSFLDRLFSGLVAISIAGAQVGQRPTINFVSGATAVDNPATNSVDVTISGGGGGGGVDSVNGAAGALTIAQGTGVTVSTVGTVITISGVAPGSNGQVRVTAGGVSAWAMPAGDWSGAVTANVVAKLRGASVGSAGGALTTGAVLRVTGANAIDYGAVDLANVNAVTGALPVTSIAPSSTTGWVLTTTSGGSTVAWAAPSGGGGYTPPTGNGIPHITTGGQDVAAIHGSAGQFLASNAGGTDATFVTMSGDATLVAGAITVTRVNGITISGTAVAGNQPIASSGSAAAWGALNLAGGSNFVSGLLPIANLATPNFGSQTITTTGATNTGTLTATGLAIAASLRVSGLGAGVGKLDGSGNLSSALVTSSDIDASVASTSYVDTKVQGLSTKASVLAATSAALPACTYSNGSSGVGATLTMNAVGAVTIDGQAAALNGRYLVKDQASTLQNGLFACSTLGTGGVAAVFTRTTDFDQAAEMPGAYVFVEDGTANSASGWVMSVDAITVGTTGIVWTQFSGAGEITVVAPLAKSGNQLSIANIADTSISATAAIAGTKISPDFGAQIVNSTLSYKLNSLLVANYSSGPNVLNLGLGFASTTLGFTGGEVMRVENGGVALFTTGVTASYGSGVGVLSVKDATTAASTNPTGGFVHWSASGRPNWRTADGDVWALSVQTDTLTGTSVTSQPRLQHTGNFGIFPAPSAAGSNVAGAPLDIGGGLGTGSAGGGNVRIFVNTAKAGGSTAQDSHTMAIYAISAGISGAKVAINSAGTTPDLELHVFGQVQATQQVRASSFAGLVGVATAWDVINWSAAMSSQTSLTTGSSGTPSQVEQPIFNATSVMSADGGYQLPLKAGAFYYIYNNTTDTAPGTATWLFQVGGATGTQVYCARGSITKVVCPDAANYVRADGSTVNETIVSVAHGTVVANYDTAIAKLPAGARILQITGVPTTTFAGGVSTFSFGTAAGGATIIKAAAVTSNTLGLLMSDLGTDMDPLKGYWAVYSGATTVWLRQAQTSATCTAGVMKVRIVWDMP